MKRRNNYNYELHVDEEDGITVSVTYYEREKDARLDGMRSGRPYRIYKIENK